MHFHLISGGTLVSKARRAQMERTNIHRRLKNRRKMSNLKFRRGGNAPLNMRTPAREHARARERLSVDRYLSDKCHRESS